MKKMYEYYIPKDILRPILIHNYDDLTFIIREYDDLKDKYEPHVHFVETDSYGIHFVKVNNNPKDICEAVKELIRLHSEYTFFSFYDYITVAHRDLNGQKELCLIYTQKEPKDLNGKILNRTHWID